MKQLAQSLLHFGGVNLNKDARVLRPDQLALSKNAFPVIPGILGKRNGIVAKQIAILGTTNQFLPLSWGLLPPQIGLKYVAHMHKMGATPKQWLVASNFDNETSTISNGVGKDIGDPLSDYEPVKFVNYRGRCIAIVPGAEGYWVLEPKPSGGYEWIKNTFRFDPAIVGVQNSQLIDIKPKVGCQYKQRMVWGNFGPGMGNWICFADKATTTVLQPLFGHSLMSLIGADALSLNGRHVEVGAIEGEEIVAMQEVTLGAVGSAVDSVLMILTNRSCVFISGEILQTNENDAYEPNGLFGSYKEHRINYECGSVSHQTLTKTPYGWIWAGPDEVWLLSGNTPMRIGTNIRPALLACPPSSRKYWSAAYANGVYVLQLVTANTTRSDGASGDLTSYIHEYWYLDLRQGSPQSPDDAQWYGPMQVLNENGSTYQFGPILSDVQDDGEHVSGLVINIDGRNLCIADFLSNNDALDIRQPGVVTGNVWTASTTYGPKDVVRVPKVTGTAGKTNRLHVCITQALDFDNQVVNFTIGENVTGGWSGATGTIAGMIDNGASGTLLLKNVVGAFRDDEGLTGHLGGDGLVNGALYLGTSGGSNPTWANSNGGETTDGTIVWQEILGADAAAIGVQLLQRVSAEYQADIRYRDNLLNDTSHEKLVRRVDINAAAQNKLNLTATALLDQGNEPKSLGTITFGGESLRGDFDTLDAVIGGLKSRAKSFRPTETNLIQCRTAQIKINDETSFIIDDTNDKLALVFTSGVSIPAVGDPGSVTIQVSIPHGNYSLLSNLMTAIKDALNAPAVLTALTASGMTLGANPWSTTSTGTGTYPYFENLVLTTTSPGSHEFGSIWHYTADVTVTAGFIANDVTETTLYSARSKRLSAMLGMVTDTMFTNQAFVSSNVFRFDGIEINHDKNSKRFDISSAIVVVQPKTATPFKNINRS